MVQLSVRSHWNLEVNTFATKLHEIILKLSRNLEEEEKLHLKLVLADAEDSVVVNEEGDVGELHGGVGRQHGVVRLHHGGRCLPVLQIIVTMKRKIAMVILSAIQHCYGQYLYSSVGINNFARALFYGVDFFSLFKFNQTSMINLWSWIDGKVKFVFLCKVKAEPFLDVPDNYLNDNFNDNLDYDGNGKVVS